jgi:hypothetical protein
VLDEKNRENRLPEGQKPQKTYFYMLYNEINYDSLCKEYYNILTLNKEPQGILKDYTKLINITMPSTNETYNSRCTIAITNNLLNINNHNNNHNNNNNNNNKYSNLLMLEDLNDLTEFLINNNYIIDNSITKIYKNTNNYNNYKKLIYSFKITL